MRTEISCPLCGGVLWEEMDGRLTTYRCDAGHLYSPDSLLAVQGEGLDTAIWRPIRMLQERGALLRRLAARAKSQDRERSARYFEQESEAALRRAAEMRSIVSGHEVDGGGAPASRRGDAIAGGEAPGLSRGVEAMGGGAAAPGDGEDVEERSA